MQTNTHGAVVMAYSFKNYSFKNYSRKKDMPEDYQVYLEEQNARKDRSVPPLPEHLWRQRIAQQNKTP